MQYPRLSLRSVLDALDIDDTSLPFLEGAGLDDLTRKGRAPHNVYAAIRDIGAALDAQGRADQLADDLEERTDIISHKLKFITAENRPRVLLLLDSAPLPSDVGSFLDELVLLAGGTPYTPNADRGPDIVIAINEMPMPQLLAELPEMLAKRHWADVPAVTDNRIYIVHNRGNLRQPGTQIADDAEILAEIIHPKQFIFGRDEDAWMKFDWQ